MFFRVFKMFLVGLATVVRLCFTSDIVLLIDWLYCIDLFSCIAASVFNKLTYLLTYTQPIVEDRGNSNAHIVPLHDDDTISGQSNEHDYQDR